MECLLTFVLALDKTIFDGIKTLSQGATFGHFIVLIGQPEVISSCIYDISCCRALPDVLSRPEPEGANLDQVFHVIVGRGLLDVVLQDPDDPLERLVPLLGHVPDFLVDGPEQFRILSDELVLPGRWRLGLKRVFRLLAGRGFEPRCRLIYAYEEQTKITFSFKRITNKD